MASLPGHAVAVLGLGAVLALPKASKRLWVWALVLAMAPDLDVAGLALGIPYGSSWGHQGMSHSALAALLMAGGALLWERRRRPDLPLLRTGLFLFLACLSHGLLDAATSGGLGVGFALPFHDQRYFLPWRPIRVSPIGTAFFSVRGLQVLRSEVLWIALPAAALAALGWALRRDPRAAID